MFSTLEKIRKQSEEERYARRWRVSPLSFPPSLSLALSFSLARSLARNVHSNFPRGRASHVNEGASSLFIRERHEMCIAPFFFLFSFFPASFWKASAYVDCVSSGQKAGTKNFRSETKCVVARLTTRSNSNETREKERERYEIESNRDEMDMDGRGRRWTIVFSNLFRRDFEVRGVYLKGGRSLKSWRERAWI